MTYNVGELIRLSVVFTDLSEIPTDPTVVTASVRSPSGTITNYTEPTIVNNSLIVGGYHLDITPTEAGLWAYRFVGSGNISVIEESTFTVIASIVGAFPSQAGLYATIADMRAWGITLEEIGNDDLMTRILTAQGLVNDYTGTRFGAVASTLTFYQVRTPLVNLPRPFSSISAVTMNGTLLGTDRWQVTEWGIELSQCGVFWGNYLTADFVGYAIGISWPVLPYPYSYDPIGQTVTVTGIFGEATVPLAVNQATVLLAARLVRDRNMLTAGNAGGRITSESMQAFSRSWALARGADVQIKTTGDATVDDMLYVWRAQPQSHIA